MDDGLGSSSQKGPKLEGSRPRWSPAFRYKAFPRVAAIVRDCLWELTDGAEPFPAWFVEGRTVLIPKAGCEGRPEQFRPITCLNNGYKLYTGALTMEHVDRTGVLPEEQKALRKG